MRVFRKRDPLYHEYTLHGKVLVVVESVKHLGVTTTSHLRWNQHISNIRTKGNQTRLPAKKSQNSLSRPEIDRLQGLSPAQCGIPSSTVWDPYTKQNKDRVEMV